MSALAHQPNREPQLPKPCMIRLDEIHFDSDYQRGTDSGHVQKIVVGWDPNRCDPLHLSARGGRLWCFDGQHRVAAMRQLGITAWWAFVIAGMTKQQEAEEFIRRQEGSKRLNAWDQWKAALVACRQDAMAILRVVQRYGFRLSPVSGPNHIGAIGAVRRIFTLGGESILVLTLETTARYWPEAIADRKSLAKQGISLEGLAIFLHSFRAEPQYDERRTHVVLEKNSPAVFLRKAQEIAMNRRRSNAGPVMVAEAIRDTYNAGIKRKDRKLGVIRKLRASPKKVPA